MLKIGLKNFRSLKDVGPIEIRPITILVGENSSGKSSLTRLFPLLRQSVEVRSNTPVLWFGDIVDFGSFDSVVHRAAKDEPVEIEIEASPGEFFFGSSHSIIRAIRKDLKSVAFRLSLKKDGKNTRVSGFEIRLNDDKVEVNVSRDGEIESTLINGSDFTDFLSAGDFRIETQTLVPQIRYRPPRSPEKERDAPLQPATREIRKVLTSRLHANFDTGTVASLQSQIRYSPRYSKFLQSFRSVGAQYASWNEYSGFLAAKHGARDGERLKSLFLIEGLPIFLSHIQSWVRAVLSKTAYIGPSRATGQRYYRAQELSIEAINPGDVPISVEIRGAGVAG